MEKIYASKPRKDLKFDWWIVQTEPVEITSTPVETPIETPVENPLTPVDSSSSITPVETPIPTPEGVPDASIGTGGTPTESVGAEPEPLPAVAPAGAEEGTPTPTETPAETPTENPAITPVQQPIQEPTLELAPPQASIEPQPTPEATAGEAIQ